MPAELMSPSSQIDRSKGATQIDGEVRCALTGRALQPEEAYWAPPLVTAGDLVSTIWRTLISAPGNLGQVLMSEQPNVPYAPEARPELARRRSSEQLKLLGLLLLIAAALIIPIVMMVG